MNLIALETATDVCATALLRNGQVVTELALNRPRAHAENLVPLIQEALAYGGIGAQDLDAVAVSMGPGSYTGLRIGVSTAKGLAAALGARLVGVPTLEGLAAPVLSAAGAGTVVTLLNSRRDEVYAAAYRPGPDGLPEEIAPPAALHLDDLPARLDDLAHPVTAVGEGVPKAATLLRTAFGDAVRLLDPGEHPPSAAWIGRLGHARLERGEAADVAAFEPYYLKDFVAKKRERTIFERLPF